MNSAVKIPALFFSADRWLFLQRKTLFAPRRKVVLRCRHYHQQSSGCKDKEDRNQEQPGKVCDTKRNKFLFSNRINCGGGTRLDNLRKKKDSRTGSGIPLANRLCSFSHLTPEINAQSMQTQLENDGYFNSKVRFDTFMKKNKWKLVYAATVQRPYWQEKFPGCPTAAV